MRRRILFLGMISSTAVAMAFQAVAEERPVLRGASDVVRAIQQAGDIKESDSPEAKPAQELLDRLEAFERNVKTFPPEKAAAEWLALLDTASGRSKPNSGMSTIWQPMISQLVWQAMPGPESWPELSKQIDAREVPAKGKEALAAMALRMFGHVLIGNREAQQADAKTLHALVASSRSKGGSPARAPFGFGGAQADMVDYQMMQAWPLIWYASKGEDPESIANLWVEQATTGQGYIERQNLVALVGEDKARPAIEKYVAHLAKAGPDSARGGYGGDSSDPTYRLIKAEVLKQVDTFKTPPWQFVDNSKDMPLYEAIAAKFPGDRSPTRQSADMQFLIGLIASGQADKAVELYRSTMASEEHQQQGNFLGYAWLERQHDPAWRKALADFYARLIDDRSPPGLWKSYFESAVDQQQRLRMIAALEYRLRQQPEDRKLEFEAVLIDALFAADRLDDAIARSQALLTDVKPAEATGPQVQAAMRLARIGQFTGRAEIEKSGLDFVVAAIRGQAPGIRNPSQGDDYQNVFIPQSDDWTMLIKAGHAADVENLLQQQLQAEVRQLAEQYRYSSFGSMMGGSGQTLTKLAELYLTSGRPADVVALLDTAPWWSIADLGDVTARRAHHEALIAGMGGFNVPVTAARALAAVGRKDDARRIVHALLAEPVSVDGPYELLLELDGEAALDRLDKLSKLDQFQERPLIWKAKLLLDLGRLDDAEQVARAAIAIDPSDGEQGKGSRMIVYGVLADILKKKGGEKNLADAAIYGQAVKAIRLAEKADEMRAAGLHARAISTYEAALDLFVDAYCIQSRLALELAQAGRTEEASAHFQKAFELMPDSFGRIESHCFGCEGIFQEGLAREIAERVFERLVKERPDKPQVHYLLGYLRESQDRLPEALAHFQKAVELDPDYYNAWQHIDQLNRKLNRADDAAALALLRLRGPIMISHGESFSGDPAKLWRLVAEREAGIDAQPKSIYPLAASAELIAETRKQNATSQGMPALAGLRFRGEPLNLEHGFMSGEGNTPAVVLLRSNPALTAVQQILSSGY